MELIKLSLNNENKIPNDIVACIGEFDGVHIAHQKLIEEVVSISKKKQLKSAIITFDPHPDFVLKKKNDFTYITPLKDKISYVQSKYDLDYFIVINFSIELSQLPYIDFYNMFLKTLDTVVIGFDFRFGYRGLGNGSVLKELHDNVVVIEKIAINDEKIGSTNIIELLSNGKIQEVNKLLGRNYTLSGNVSLGSQIGNKIGYPTANIDIDENYCLLKQGVYAVNVIVDNKKHLGIANYGYNPSFNQVVKPRLEVNIFDFNEDIYSKYIEVEFLENIREELKFNSIDDFLIQIQKDCQYCITKYGG